jgi:uncharacterized protein YacL (UPF0231 family)
MSCEEEKKLFSKQNLEALCMLCVAKASMVITQAVERLDSEWGRKKVQEDVLKMVHDAWLMNKDTPKEEPRRGYSSEGLSLYGEDDFIDYHTAIRSLAKEVRDMHQFITVWTNVTKREATKREATNGKV